MGKPIGKTPERRTAVERGPTSSSSSPPTPKAGTAVDGRFAAPGDEPLAIATTLALDEPFRFDRGLAKRLRMREVNATEAFTLRDSSGAYLRASVQAYDA